MYCIPYYLLPHTLDPLHGHRLCARDDLKASVTAGSHHLVSFSSVYMISACSRGLLFAKSCCCNSPTICTEEYKFNKISLFIASVFDVEASFLF